MKPAPKRKSRSKEEPLQEEVAVLAAPSLKRKSRNKEEPLLEEVAVVTEPPPRVHDFRGNFDACGPTLITGWLNDKNDSEAMFEVEVRVDGMPVACTKADLFRMDLLESGMRGGLCAFQLPLPEVLYDGAEHVVELREMSSGFLLPGSPRKLEATAALRGDIHLKDGVLVGSARLRANSPYPSALEVLDVQSGQIVATGRTERDGNDERFIRFNIPLPASVFDGRAHGFHIQAKDHAVLVQSIAVVMPFVSTPESALLRYARHGLAPSVGAAAGMRYDSLTKAMQYLAQNEQQTTATTGLTLVEQLAQLTRVHAQIVRGFDARDKVFEPLVFPKWEQPIASIVIPVHNKFHVTYHCLASLLLAPNRATFEVILVDDGSSDATLQVPETVKGIHYVRNDTSQGFIRSCNRGGTFARGQYIVMLNNDTEVTANWLDELLWPFDNFQGVGMTGAKLLYPDGTLQEAGGIVWDTGNPWNYGRNANARDPRYNYTRQTDYLSGACLMLPTTLWNEIGGFSERYVPAYFEDTDLGFQVRERGFKTVYTPLSQVFHFEGVSNGTNVSSGMKRFQEINRPKFKSRWNSAFRGNGREGVDVELNKDRNVALRALIIDAQIPMPDQDAGSYAAVQEIRMLQALGFKCTFVPQNLAWMGHYTQDMQRMGVECLFAPFQTSINQVLEERGNEFDLVYITRYYVAKGYLDMIRQRAPRAKIVLMNADLHFLRELRLALQTKNAEDMAKSLQTREEELAVMRKVDLVLSYTDVERAVILSHNLDSTKVAKCPWVTEIASNVPGWDARSDVAFLGGYNHVPNVQAVEWFAKQVMPVMRQKLPGVKFHVYGSQMPDSFAELAAGHDDIVLHGWVPTVQAVYDSCRVFVAPLQTGAGIKGKVIGALAHGVPTVMTPIAAEGLSLSAGVDAAIAAQPAEWVNAIAKVYNDPKAWQKMSAGALEFARNQYGYDQAVRQMKQALEEAEFFVNITDKALASPVSQTGD
jgi:GT2 family glycosyltransferase/glycosyltransferase involved in cell wall biosynthesis